MKILLMLLLLSGCATSVSTPEIKRTPPSECLTSCPKITPPASGDPNVIFQWEIEQIIAYGECRRMHESCIGWVKVPEPAKPAEKRWWQR